MLSLISSLQRTPSSESQIRWGKLVESLSVRHQALLPRLNRRLSKAMHLPRRVGFNSSLQTTYPPCAALPPYTSSGLLSFPFPWMCRQGWPKRKTEELKSTLPILFQAALLSHHRCCTLPPTPLYNSIPFLPGRGKDKQGRRLPLGCIRTVTHRASVQTLTLRLRCRRTPQLVLTKEFSSRSGSIERRLWVNSCLRQTLCFHTPSESANS